MESRLVPEIFEKLDTNNWLNVEFEKGIKMEQGNLLKPALLSKLPHISWDADDNKFYTVAIFDPDVSIILDPNRESLQFLAYNIKGSNLNSGKIFADYLPPSLTKDSPRHRLVFAVYEQQGEIFPTEKPLSNVALERNDFHLQDWRNKYNLGQPIAYNFFQSEFDESYVTNTLLSSIVEGVQTSMHYLGEKVQAGYETVKEGMHEFAERVHEKKEELKQKAEEIKEDIKEGAQDLKEQVQDKKEDLKQEFQEKKSKVQQQPSIDVRQGAKSPSVDFPSVHNNIEKFETLATQPSTTPLMTETPVIISTQPVISSSPTTLTSESTPSETAPSLLNRVAEGIQTGVHVIGENLQAGYEVLKEKVQEGAEVVKENVQTGYEVAKDKVSSGIETLKEGAQQGVQVVKENVQAGYEVAKDKVSSGIETLKEGAQQGVQVVKENVQAGYEVAKEKTLEKTEQLQKGFQDVKEDMKEGMQNVSENIKEGAQQVSENLAPTPTTSSSSVSTEKLPPLQEQIKKFENLATSPTSPSSGSTQQFPTMQEQIQNFEKLVTMNEDLSFLNEGAPAQEVKGEFQPFGGDSLDEVDIAIAKDQPQQGFGQNIPEKKPENKF